MFPLPIDCLAARSFLSAFSENTVVAQSFLLDYIATAEAQQALYDADPRNPAFVPVADAWTGVPRNSYAEFMHGLYKLLKAPADRVLGTAINETIDASVWQRWRADASYRSPALVRALDDARMTVPPIIAGG